MVTSQFVLVSELSGLWIQALARNIELCLWARHHCHNASLHPSVQMGTGKLYTGGNPAMGGVEMGGVEIFPVAICYRYWDELRPDRLLGSYAELILCSVTATVVLNTYPISE